MSDSHNNFYFVGDKWAESFDETRPLPDAGAHRILDSFCEAKHLTIPDLVRVGGRLKGVGADENILAIAYPDGIKYRDLMTGKKWAAYGSKWEPPKVVPGADRSRCVVVEGETDAARMAGPDGPGADVFVLGGGARYIPDSYIDILAAYELVFVATDDDLAGNEGGAVIERALGAKAVRWVPPANDWCEADAIGAPPEPPQPPPLIAWGAELHDLDYLDEPSYLPNALLPVSGMMMLHAWKGSYKSWLSFDLMLALATGGSWAGFECLAPEAKCLIVQFELGATFYQDRMRWLSQQLPSEALTRYHNLGTYSPMTLINMNVNSPQWQTHFVELCRKNKVDVILFDPIRRMIGGKSIYEQETQMALVQFFRLLNMAGVAVIFTHHDSKSSARTGGGSPLDATAADALVGAADSIVSVALPYGETMGVSTKRNLHFTVRNGPNILPRAFSLDGDRLEYHDEAFGLQDADEEVSDAPGL